MDETAFNKGCKSRVEMAVENRDVCVLQEVLDVQIFVGV